MNNVRDEIAKIIDPMAAEMLGRVTASHAVNLANEHAWSMALTKADSILSLFSQERERGERMERALEEARDLLLERTRGSHARSPGHNARLVIDAALSKGAG